MLKLRDIVVVSLLHYSFYLRLICIVYHSAVVSGSMMHFLILGPMVFCPAHCINRFLANGLNLSNGVGPHTFT